MGGDRAVESITELMYIVSLEGSRSAAVAKRREQKAEARLSCLLPFKPQEN